LFFEIRSIELLIMKEGEVGMEHQVREPPSHVSLCLPFFPSLFGNGVELLLPYIRRLTRPDRRHRQVAGCHRKIPKPRAAASALPRCDRPGVRNRARAWPQKPQQQPWLPAAAGLVPVHVKSRLVGGDLGRPGVHAAEGSACIMCIWGWTALPACGYGAVTDASGIGAVLSDALESRGRRGRGSQQGMQCSGREFGEGDQESS
jgi:hypothetical protein